MLKYKYLTKLITFFVKSKHDKCNHLFDPKDMQPRDKDGNVKWKCCKCDHEFTAHCGLDILKNGTCTGNWHINHIT